MTQVKVFTTDNIPTANQIQTTINDFCETVDTQGGTVKDIKILVEPACFNVESFLVVMIVYETA